MYLPKFLADRTKTNDIDVCLEVVSRSFNHCVTFAILGTGLELAAQKVDRSRYEVLGRQSFDQNIFGPRSRNDQLSRLCRTQVTMASAL